MIVCGISAWRDYDLASDAVRSVGAMPVVILDGAYRTYSRDDWRTPSADTMVAQGDGPVTVIEPAREWASEAEKKTALVCHVRRLYPAADWLLILDTDERLEGVIPPLSDGAEWATLEIYHPQGPPGHYPIPRLLRLDPSLHFSPPRDYDAYSRGHRVAYLDGEPVPRSMRYDAVPWEQARIRHDRHLRPADRMRMSRHYLIRRDQPERAEERIRADE